MKKKTAALLATVVSLGGGAGVMGALAPGAQAKGQEEGAGHETWNCFGANGGVTVTGNKQKDFWEDRNFVCFDADSP